MNHLHNVRITGTIASLVVALTVFLPWVTLSVGLFSRPASGLDSDGIAFALGALATAVFAVLGMRRTVGWLMLGYVLCTVADFVVLAVTAPATTGIASVTVSPGSGMVLGCLFAGATATWFLYGTHVVRRAHAFETVVSG